MDSVSLDDEKDEYTKPDYTFLREIFDITSQSSQKDIFNNFVKKAFKCQNIIELVDFYFDTKDNPELIEPQ